VQAQVVSYITKWVDAYRVKGTDGAMGVRVSHDGCGGAYIYGRRGNSLSLPSQIFMRLDLPYVHRTVVIARGEYLVSRIGRLHVARSEIVREAGIVVKSGVFAVHSIDRRNLRAAKISTPVVGDATE